MKTIPDTIILPPHTISGHGASSHLLEECLAFGSRGLIVHGKSLELNGRLNNIITQCPPDGNIANWRSPGGEPTLAMLEDLMERARAFRPDWIAAVGGGSILDIAKACAGLLQAPLPIKNYHDGAPIPPSRTPFIAVPTTAGTGSESTIVSVLSDEEKGVKKSIRHPSFMARLIILDHELLTTCPPQVIAHSGMDALTQAIESFTSTGSTWFTDKLAIKAIDLISSSLTRVYEDPHGDKARNLMQGSYLAGLSLSLARLGLVHGMAHPLGIRFHAPHGLVCAVCLPEVLEFNRTLIDDKYEIMSRIVNDDIVKYARKLIKQLNIQSPFAGKNMPPDTNAIINETLASGSTKSNPRPVAAGDIQKLLEKLFA